MLHHRRMSGNDPKARLDSLGERIEHRKAHVQDPGVDTRLQESPKPETRQERIRRQALEMSEWALSRDEAIARGLPVDDSLKWRMPRWLRSWTFFICFLRHYKP